MTILSGFPSIPPDSDSAVPELEAGARLNQKAFHERYERMPNHVRAELIDGEVHMASPLKRAHAQSHICLAGWALEYARATPGVIAFDNASVILSEDTEVQPDVCVFIEPGHGGQVRYDGDYLGGAPEFIGEVALSSESIDLHKKRTAYERAGVREYLVIALRTSQLFWWVNKQGAFEPMPTDEDGIIRSNVFPGLWLDGAALLRNDINRVMEVVKLGIADPRHDAWITES